jgi:hypothetical protein
MLVVLFSPKVAFAAKHDFKVVNKGDHQVDHVYLSPPDEKNWGPDQLDNDVIAPGGEQVWSISDECVEDVKVVYHDGKEWIGPKFDTCQFDLDLNY